MKILFVLEHYYPNIGGVEKLFKQLAESLVLQNYEVTVVTTKYKSQLPAKQLINGVQIVRLPLRNRYFFTFFAWLFCLKLAKKAQLIHTTSYNAAVPAFILGKIFSKPVYITFHEVWGKLWFKLPFLNPIEKFLFYLFEQIILKLPFTKTIAVSNFTFNKLLKNKVKNVVCIHNGITYNQTITNWNEPQSSFTFTFFGRLGVSKGLDLIIPAARQFLEKHPDSIFNLITPRHPKALYNKVKKMVYKTQYPQIRFYHELSNEGLSEKLFASHCIVIPSYSEGFGFAALESAALGIPLISSNKGALPEVVSGKVIWVNNQDVKSYFEALEKAKAKKFEEVSPILWPIENTVLQYVELYKKNNKV